MTTLYKYTFRCTTEGIDKDVWRNDTDPVPTKCPDDTAHTIDTSSIRITEKVEKQLMQVEEESTPTGGNFKAISKLISLNASETKITDFQFKYPISALALEFMADTENQGDNFEMIIGPDTIVGTITADVAINDTVITVSDTVLANVEIGYKVNLFDGVNTEELGYVLAIDKDNKTITVENQSTQAFSASPPTYVRMNVYVMEDYIIGKPGRWVIGESKIGGSYIPANTMIRFIYYNNEAAAKTYTAQLEYLY